MNSQWGKVHKQADVEMNHNKVLFWVTLRVLVAVVQFFDIFCNSDLPNFYFFFSKK